MNKDMIKNLHQAMLSTATAALVSIGFMACSDETFVTQNSTVSADGYQVCISANIGGGDTRAIAYNDDTKGYDATFETTDLIYVYNVTKDQWSWYRLNPDADGKSANLIGRLFFDNTTPEVNDELRLYYKSDVFNYSRDFARDDIADYALANVTITDVSDDGNITTSDAIFQNYQSVYKFKFTEIASDVKIKKLTISSGQNKLVSIYRDYGYYPNEFGSVTYVYKDEGIAEHELVCLLRFADNPYYNPDTESSSGDVISFTAIGDDGHYYMGKKEVTGNLENGKYYQADVSMTDGGSAMKVTNTTTGETLESSTYYQVYTNDADYLAENNGYGTCIEWYGGNDDNHTLTIKNLTIENSGDKAIAVKHGDGADNTKVVHKLVLDGVNTLSVTGNQNSLTVQDNCSLIISSASTGTGKLNLKANDQCLGLWENATVTIESGEVTLDGYLGLSNTSSCVIGAKGKLRILTEKIYPTTTAVIKAANGYALVTTKDGDYTEFTVTEAPPYENPKALADATSEDVGKIIGSDGNVHVLYWALPEGVSPVGMLASISSTGHGLAIAKNIQVKKSYEWGGYDIYKYFSWGDSYWTNEGKTATEIFNDWAAENSVGFGEWRIPTKADCQNMILSCRIDGDANEASDENMTANGFKSKLTEAGICTNNYLYCWTSTQLDDEWMVYMGVEINDEGSSIANFNTTDVDATSAIFPVLEF